MHYPTVFDVPAKHNRVQEIVALQQEPDFWNDHTRAATLTQELSEIEKDISFVEDTQKKLSELQDLSAMAQSEGDESTAKDIATELESIEKTLQEKEKLLAFSGPHDATNAIISIQAGAGGTDAQDWANMLSRMYVRFAERKGWKASLIEETLGEEAGIKHATLLIQGPYAYGILKGEHGVHRLVRLSPFNANNLRQTSFARVEVLPELQEKDAPVIDPKDLEIDTFRASGAGGQHVNKTSSAVRIRHIPTGIVTQSQSQRSQAQNKATAMSLLAARIQMLLEEQHVQEVQDLKGTHMEAAFGSQIRSYVLHPYTLVKDHRTNGETHNANAVLDGDLDLFMLY